MTGKINTTRRTFLTALGVGSTAYALHSWLKPRSVRAAPDDPSAPLLIYVYLGGGWDTLLSLDPRDNTKFVDADSNESGIVTAYGDIAVNDQQVAAVLQETGGTGLVQPQGSNIVFGPAIGEIKKHYDKLCIVRGVNMGTLSHQVGRRYFNTGKVPRGQTASGSSMSTVLADRHLDHSDVWLPQLQLGGGEVYNEGLSPRASPTRIGGYESLAPLLRPADVLGSLNNPVGSASTQYAKLDHCIHQRLGGSRAFEAFRDSQAVAEILASGVLWEHFDFVSKPAPDTAIARVYDAFQIDPERPQNALRGPLGQGAIAAQALANGICQTVAMAPVLALDTHGINWTTQQLLQRDGLDTVSRLIDFLETNPDPQNPSHALWERTTLICYSEFSRTPRLNDEGGRDHHLGNCCLVAGPNIQGNTVVGASSDRNYMPESIDPMSGAVVDSEQSQAIQVKPSDVHATVLTSIGESFEHISNQNPVLLESMLK